MAHGPSVSVMNVFRDFLIYKEGVYEVIPGTSNLNTKQAVKLIGWGRDEDSSYWLVENSWGESWGENGVAKVKIG